MRCAALDGCATLRPCSPCWGKQRARCLLRECLLWSATPSPSKQVEAHPYFRNEQLLQWCKVPSAASCQQLSSWELSRTHPSCAACCQPADAACTAVASAAGCATLGTAGC